MGNAKVHWVDKTLWGDDLPETLCGITHAPFTHYPERITCNICRGQIKKSWKEGDDQDKMDMAMSTGSSRPIIK
jgi:hypothetical protein